MAVKSGGLTQQEFLERAKRKMDEMNEAKLDELDDAVKQENAALKQENNILRAKLLDWFDEVKREKDELKQEITILRQENKTLKQENADVKKETIVLVQEKDQEITKLKNQLNNLEMKFHYELKLREKDTEIKSKDAESAERVLTQLELHHKQIITQLELYRDHTFEMDRLRENVDVRMATIEKDKAAIEKDKLAIEKEKQITLKTIDKENKMLNMISKMMDMISSTPNEDDIAMCNNAEDSYEDSDDDDNTPAAEWVKATKKTKFDRLRNDQAQEILAETDMLGGITERVLKVLFHEITNARVIRHNKQYEHI